MAPALQSGHWGGDDFPVLFKANVGSGKSFVGSSGPRGHDFPPSKLFPFEFVPEVITDFFGEGSFFGVFGWVPIFEGGGGNPIPALRDSFQVSAEGLGGFIVGGCQSASFGKLVGESVLDFDLDFGRDPSGVLA